MYKFNISTNNLIALCHLLKNGDSFDGVEYEKFIKNLEKFTNHKFDIDLITSLSYVSKGDKYLVDPKIEEFYKENKRVIDKINKYSFLLVFYTQYCNSDGVLDNGIYNAYKYLLENKDNLLEILEVLEKIKSLGLGYIIFDDSLDFTKEESHIENYYCNKKFAFFDNMELLESEKDDIISYKSISSNYEITAYISGNKINLNGRMIRLNSLVFHPSRLPNEMSKEETYDVLLDMVLKKNFNQLNAKIEKYLSSIKRSKSSKKIEEGISTLSDIKDDLEALNEDNHKDEYKKIL